MRAYNKTWEDQKIPFTIDTQNDYTELTNDQILSLTGFKGYKRPKSKSIPEIKISGTYPLMNVIVKLPTLYLERVINFENNRIYNSSMKLKKTRRGTGTRILRSQVASSQSIGFKKLRCRAGGCKSDTLNGYITWGKLGYSMENNQEKDLLITKLSQYATENKTTGEAYTLVDNLNDLLQFEPGAKFWEDAGFPWFAEFYLTAPSRNIDYLNMYLTKRKLEIISSTPAVP